MRRGSPTEDQLREAVDDAIDTVVPVDLTISECAAQLRARHHSLLTPDALIIASAQQTGADVLLTGDKKLKSVAPDLVELVCP